MDLVQLYASFEQQQQLKRKTMLSERMASKKHFFVIHLKRMWFLLLYSALELEWAGSAAAAATAVAATNQNSAMLLDIKTGTCVILI